MLLSFVYCFRKEIMASVGLRYHSLCLAYIKVLLIFLTLSNLVNSVLEFPGVEEMLKRHFDGKSVQFVSRALRIRKHNSNGI